MKQNLCNLGCQYNKEQINSTSKHKEINRFFPKLFVCLFSLCILVKMNYFTSNIFQREVKCFEDKSFVYTIKVYDYLKSNETLLNIFLIIAGILIDFVVILGSVFYSIKFPSWRMLITIFALYLIRGFVQGIFLMDHPEDQIFQYPGISSLVVSYFKTNDYFFSGHVSIPTIIGVEFWRHGYKKLSFFCYFTCFFELLLMVFTRGHYSIDLYAGVIFSFYFCRIIDETISNWIDKKIGYEIKQI